MSGVANFEAQRYTTNVKGQVLECIYIESCKLNIKSDGSVSPRDAPRTPLALRNAIDTTLSEITQGKRDKNWELLQSHKDRSFQVFSALCKAYDNSALTKITIPRGIIDKIVTAYAQKNPAGIRKLILESTLFKKKVSSEDEGKV